MRKVVVIPTYNEQGNVSRLIPRLFELYPEVGVFIVDDNSPDGTGETVRNLMQKFKNLHFHSRPRKMGLASAYKEAIRKILSENQDIESIITMDADLSHDPGIIHIMLNQITDYDLIIGSRYVPGGSFQNWTWWRKLLSRCGNIYARLICGAPIHDMTGGFHCFRASLLKQYDFDKIRSTGYSYQIEIKMNAYRLGARIKEIPITFVDRSEGQSKLSNATVLEGIIAPWRIRFSRLPNQTKYRA